MPWAGEFASPWICRIAHYKELKLLEDVVVYLSLCDAFKNLPFFDIMRIVIFSKRWIVTPSVLPHRPLLFLCLRSMRALTALWICLLVAPFFDFFSLFIKNGVLKDRLTDRRTEALALGFLKAGIYGLYLWSELSRTNNLMHLLSSKTTPCLRKLQFWHTQLQRERQELFEDSPKSVDWSRITIEDIQKCD